MSPYYFSKSNRYYFRIKVPVDLLECFGRIEIQRTLHTSSQKHATSLAAKKHAEFERLFHLIRLAPTEEEKRSYVQQTFPRRKTRKQILHQSKRLSQLVGDNTSEYKYRWRGKTAQEMITNSRLS
jgi:hypothetical protein